MRFIATINLIACSGAVSIGLVASAASAEGYYGRRASPHVIEASDVVPTRHAGAARHFVRQGRHAYRAAPLASDSGVFYRANGERRYDDSYRPAAYNAADAYPPPPPPAYGYVVPVVLSPYPASDYIELTGYPPLPHIIHAAPEPQRVCPCEGER